MERNHIEYKIKIQEVSQWKKENKISNFWIVIIDDGVTKTSFRVDSKTELLQWLGEKLCIMKVKK